jgi:Protein of unknown function (DUF1656)
LNLKGQKRVIAHVLVEWSSCKVWIMPLRSSQSLGQRLIAIRHLRDVTLPRAHGAASTLRKVTPLSPLRNSGSFRIVAQFLQVFGTANRPEFRFMDLLIPWIFVVSLFGFLAAWLVIAILERTGLTRHIWHLPLFFLALVVLLTSIIGFVCFP